MSYDGIYTVGRSFLLDRIGYHVMVYRLGDNYRAFWHCCKCGFDEYQEPAISQNCVRPWPQRAN